MKTIRKYVPANHLAETLNGDTGIGATSVILVPDPARKIQRLDLLEIYEKSPSFGTQPTLILVGQALDVNRSDGLRPEWCLVTVEVVDCARRAYLEEQYEKYEKSVTPDANA